MKPQRIFENARPGVGDAGSLWMLLTIVAGAGDEKECARLAATGMPSVIPCKLCGVALRTPNETSLSFVGQEDSRQLSPAAAALIAAELEPLYEAAMKSATLVVARGAEPDTGSLIPAALRSHLFVSAKKISPLLPLIF